MIPISILANTLSYNLYTSNDKEWHSNIPYYPTTSYCHTLHRQYCQYSSIKPHSLSLQTLTANLRSGLYTASLGGGVAHAAQSHCRPNRRPKNACCRNHNETVALICWVNALAHLLLAEPSPCGGTSFQAKAL